MPIIIPDVTLQTIDQKTIIVVEVSAGKQRPYYVKSLGLEKGTYTRVSGTTRIADEYMIKELLFEGSNRCFDQSPCIGFSASTADIMALCRSLKQTAERNCKSEVAKADIKEITPNTLLSWGVLVEQDGKLIPTNAFGLLSGDFLSQAKVQCGVFKGTTRAVFVDRREFSGAIQNQVEEAYRYVLAKINLGAQIDGLYRQDEYELPIGSIREIIANAITHRSYLDQGNVQIALFDNRLEVTSPGMLLNGVTIEKMREGYSKIRNRAIANAFSYMKIIEHWGSGIPRMIEEFKLYGLEEPELIDFNGDFRVNFYRATQKPTQLRRERMDLTDSDWVIIEIIEKNPTISQSRIASELGWAVNRVKYYIKKLRDMGILIHHGNNRSGRWETTINHVKES